MLPRSQDRLLQICCSVLKTVLFQPMCPWLEQNRFRRCRMVEGVGFEPTKLSQRIYSPPQLAALVPLRMEWPARIADRRSRHVLNIVHCTLFQSTVSRSPITDQC